MKRLLIAALSGMEGKFAGFHGISQYIVVFLVFQTAEGKS
jgi:hypothetical protein